MGYLLFLRSIRYLKFSLYVHSLDKLLPRKVDFDHYNYAQWMSVHHYDIEMLQESNSSIFLEFQANGNFVVSRTKNTFSSIGLDHCHGQLKKDVKCDGGMVGLTQDEDKLRRWTVCSPDISRAVAEFEKSTVFETKEHTTFHHYEYSDSFKAIFSKQVSDLTTEFKQLGNPFLPDKAAELIQLGTRDVMDPEVINTVITIEDLGISQQKEFRENKIVKKTKGLNDPITKNKVSLFKSTNTRGQS